MKRYDIVKAELWQDRMDFVVGRPRCDACGKPLNFGCDVHHAIVRRGHVRKAWEEEELDHPINLCLVHRGCHTKAHSDTDLMVAIQIVRYGYETVRLWIRSLPFKTMFYWHRGLDEQTAQRIVEERAPWVKGVQDG